MLPTGAGFERIGTIDDHQLFIYPVVDVTFKIGCEHCFSTWSFIWLAQFEAKSMSDLIRDWKREIHEGKEPDKPEANVEDNILNRPGIFDPPKRPKIDKVVEIAIGKLELTENSVVILTAPEEWDVGRIGNFNRQIADYWSHEECPGHVIVIPHMEVTQLDISGSFFDTIYAEMKKRRIHDDHPNTYGNHGPQGTSPPFQGAQG